MSSAPLLTKHHGAGNDFLVVCDDSPAGSFDARVARLLCDRRRGFGADGLLRATPSPRPGLVARMELWNADGSPAEMSGNGIRCFAQALVRAGWAEPGALVVETGAGPRTLRLLPATENRSAEAGWPDGVDVDWVEVEMGAVTLELPLGERAGGPALGGAWPARPALVGNPHLVVLVPDAGELEALDLARLGPPLEAARPGGQNIEWIAPRPDGGLQLRVWERGVGETAACGTGSVAAAAVARAWGVVGERLTVWNPGGPLEVALAPAGARLVGDAHYVGRLEPGHDLRSLLGDAETARVGGCA